MKTQQITFKTLRHVDANTFESKPVEIKRPQRVHFENANGGLRMVDESEVRSLAAASAKRLKAAALGVE